MIKKTLLAVLANVCLALVAGAQTPARAELFTRAENGIVRAAIRVELEGAWHIYHRELGHPKAVGQPTVIELSGAGIEWSDVRFPEPVRLDQSDVGGEGTFILAHEQELVVHAVGRMGSGATGNDVQAKIKALVCEDVQGCVPFRRTLSSAGRGPDALFAAFPADLVVPATKEGTEPEAEAPLLGGGESNSPEQANGDLPTEDEIRREGADATLYVRSAGRRVDLRLVIDIDPERHLYHENLGPSPYGKPTVITLHGAGVQWGEIEWPEPLQFDQSDIEEGLYILGHEGRIILKATGEFEPGVERVDPKSIWGEITGQTCDPLTCEDYEEVFVAQGRGTDAEWNGTSVAVAGAESPRGSGSEDGAVTATTRDEWVEEDVLGSSLGGFLLAAMFWGLFTLLMPCTYPMIPITISFFTKQADKRGGKVLPLALAYGAGIVGIFILIGVAFGSVIIPFANHWVTNLVIGVAFVYFSLTLFGLVNLQPPRFLMNAAGAASTKGGYLGVFLMGATLVVTSFTCTAPFVGTLLGSAGDRTVPEVALGMGVFGLTMAFPFVLLSLVPGRIKAMPRSGEWMNTLKYSLGFVELAAALKFLSNVDIDRKLEIVSREFFLVAWGLIALALAAYLLGAGRLFGRKATVGKARGLFGALALFFGLFCFWGLPGRKMGEVMSAFLPPYSGGRFFPAWYDVGSDWSLVKNDYDSARALAREQKKLLLVNFTGEL